VGFSQNTIDNKVVIDLHEMGFEEDVIKAKINSSRDLQFDTSIDSLKSLKAKGVPSGVIALMISRSKKDVAVGIFYLAGDTIKKLQPSVFSGTKTKALAAVLTSGLASAKIKAYIHGSSSRYKVFSFNQSFIFQFDKLDGEELTGKADWWFKAASSPNEFVLTELSIREGKNQRELLTGKITSVSASTQMGVDTDKVIPFKVEDLGNGRFKVTPERKLKQGEYCFFFQGNVPQGGTQNLSIFDFTAL
jgi:hypothetical protein